MGDPYQAPRADLRDARGAPRQCGSVLTALSAGVVLWCALFLISGFVFLRFFNGKLFVDAVDELLWLETGIDSVTYIVVFHVTARIAQGREWLAAGILLVLVALAQGTYVVFVILPTDIDYSWTNLVRLGVYVICAVAGTLAGIWINKKREIKAVIP